MDENYQNNPGSKLTANEIKLWLPPVSPKDQQKLDRLQKDGKKAKQLLLTGIRISAAFVGVALIWYIFRSGWLVILVGILFLILLIPTVFNAKWTGFSGKTLWDWLQLLGVVAVPIAVGLFGASFSNAIAQEQTETSIQIAHEQEQETVLQQYLDYMSGLLTNKDLQDPIRGSQLRGVARARTVIALATLDGKRQRIALQFLVQTNFINGTNPIVDLRRINLIGINLSGADLRDINLSGVNLSESNLRGAFLNNTNLSGALLAGVYLRNASLQGANLSEADLHLADLSGALLAGAYLRNASLQGANLSGASNLTQQQLDQVFSCQGAFLPQGLVCHRTP